MQQLDDADEMLPEELEEESESEKSAEKNTFQRNAERLLREFGLPGIIGITFGSNTLII